MGMVVRTNTMAMNAFRQLNMNNNQVGKSLEKLSSGFRINRAGDDASGLAISEKMKAQIKGLETASSNSQDGISLIQTAEGALTEVHDMLNRMVELAGKASNGTMDNPVDRRALQEEMEALKDDINRISKGTNFNGIKLLDGSLGLNTGAFNIEAGAVKGNEAGQLDILKNFSALGTNDTHLGGVATTMTVPKFEVDLGDLKIVKGNGNATADGSLAISIGGKTITVNKLDTSADISASDIVDRIKAGTDVAGFITKTDVPGQKENYIDIDGLMFEVGGTGSKLTFTYKGLTANTTNATDADEFTTAQADAFNASIGGGVSVALTAGTGKGTQAGDVIHSALNVDQAVAKSDADRAGIDLKITKEMIAAGNTMTIDGVTFTFAEATDTNKHGTIAANTIYLDSNEVATNEADSIQKVVDLLSQQSGTNFEIGAKSADTIHLDQKTSYVGPAFDKYEKLTNLVTVNAPQRNAATKVTLSNANLVDGDTLKIGDKVYTFTKDATKTGKEYIQIAGTDKETIANLIAKANGNGVTITADPLDPTSFTVKSATAKAAAPFVGGSGLTLQIGDTADDFNQLTVGVENMSTIGLGIDDLSVGDQVSAKKALDKLRDLNGGGAINIVSSQRAKLGAMQNRLEHTINNLDVAAENMTSANMRIRDADMAKEMMAYTKMNVLTQAAQAMLAQANQQPQSVLQLLQ